MERDVKEKETGKMYKMKIVDENSPTGVISTIYIKPEEFKGKWSKLPYNKFIERFIFI